MRLILSFIVFTLFSPLALAANGLLSVKSAYDVPTTADRLEEILTVKGMTIFIRINHAEGASNVGEELRPTEVIIFGNPKIGTLLMQCSQSVGIDLPQKILIREDADGQVWLSYNDPKYLAKRHNIKKCTEVLNKVATALGNFAKAATQQQVTDHNENN